MYAVEKGTPDLGLTHGAAGPHKSRPEHSLGGDPRCCLEVAPRDCCLLQPTVTKNTNKRAAERAMTHVGHHPQSDRDY
jgi:hypothetical protein